MAKEDFCFTYYDGDAARDMSHMNRLQRACYNDLMMSIRKFGHLSLDQIKLILREDFEECWPAVEMIMLRDEEQKFYIEWLENSIVRAKKHSKHQSINGSKGGRPKKENPNEIQIKANQNPNNDFEKPLENGNEDGYEYKDEIKEGGMGETIKTGNSATQPIVAEMLNIWKAAKPNYIAIPSNDFQPLREIAELLRVGLKLSDPITDFKTASEVNTAWKAMVHFITEDKHFKNYQISQILKYFNAIASQMANGNQGNNKKSLVQSNKEIADEAIKLLLKKYSGMGEYSDITN